MKILIVLENYIPHIGGVEAVFKSLSEGLVKLGHEINIVTHRIKGTKKYEEINGVKVHRVNCLHSRYWFSLLAIPTIIKIAKKTDIIHTTLYTGALPAKIGSWISKKPIIITIPEILGKDWTGMGKISSKIHQVLEKIIVKLRYDKYIAISESTKRNIEKLGKKAKVIYCGVDYELFNPKNYDGKEIRKRYGLEKNFVYLFYGRPGITKGLEFLLKAVPLIKIPNAKLMAIVSRDKTYEKRYQYIIQLIKKLGIQNKIILLKPVKRKELPKYLAAADCVVVPSLTEGFGYCAAEASAMEKPVVASNTTSLPEVVSGKWVLVKTKDPEAIAKGIEMTNEKKYAKSEKKIFKASTAIKEYLKEYEALK